MTQEQHRYQEQGPSTMPVRPAEVGRESEERVALRHRQALDRIRGGLSTKVRILASHDSCPVCMAAEGAYDFEDVPSLPIEDCSHPAGCRCFYAPVLDLFGP
jgi:hypothetical protein